MAALLWCPGAWAEPGEAAPPHPESIAKGDTLPGPAGDQIGETNAGETVDPETTETGADGGDVSPEEEGDEHPAVLKAVDAVHRGISGGIEATAKRIDSFFGEERFFTDVTETYVQLGGKGSWEDDEDTTVESKVRVKLDLPGTRQRLRLLVQSAATGDEGNGDSSSLRESLEDNDYFVSLETTVAEDANWNISPALGVKASSSPDMFVRLRAVRFKSLGKWLMRFSASAAEFVDDGTVAGSRLDFDRQLSEKLLFRSSSEVLYRDEKDRTEAGHGFTFFHRLNSRHALAYEAFVQGDNDPNWDVENYGLQVRLRSRVYRKWLFVELAPQMLFRETDDYDPIAVFSLRIDGIFGARYR